MDAEGEWSLELLHHGEWIVVTPDDGRAKDALGGRPDDRGRQHDRDEQGSR
jgi:hypothetical protein